ncbi:MAG: hypothetical protein MI976_10800 [Pseudomonadales bacterium]|nr:hypothetical protein [Pseudomonadales bacterium]
MLVSTVGVYDGDYWCHGMYKKGNKIDSFCSKLTNWSKSEDEAKADTERLKGNPIKVAQAIGIDVSRIEGYYSHIELGIEYPEDVSSFEMVLDQEQLIQFIKNLYGYDPAINRRIEYLLSAEDPKMLASEFRKKITALKRQKRFVDYFESRAFGREIETLANDIFDQLVPLSAELAVDLLEKLMATAPNSLERSDDSNGDVGFAYQNITMLWLEVATRVAKPEKFWMKKIKALIDSDRYGVLDQLLPNANMLLSNTSLRELAAYYDKPVGRSELGWLDTKASANVQSVAEALGDLELFERSVLKRSSKPNSLQLHILVEFSLDHGYTERALEWLADEVIDEPDWLRFRVQTYQQLNQPKLLPNACTRLLTAEPSAKHLQIAIKACPDRIAKWQKLALKLRDMLEVADQIALQLAVDKPEAALRFAVKNYENLQECHYRALTDLLKQVPDDYPLLKVVLLRVLLLDLLNRGFNKAYPHGARYLKALRTLDNKITSYRSLESHQQLEDFLLQKHGKKRSFWALIN